MTGFNVACLVIKSGPNHEAFHKNTAASHSQQLTVTSLQITDEKRTYFSA